MGLVDRAMSEGRRVMASRGRTGRTGAGRASGMGTRRTSGMGTRRTRTPRRGTTPTSSSRLSSLKRFLPR